MDMQYHNENILFTKSEFDMTKVFLFCEEKNKKFELLQNLLFCSKQFHETISILHQSDFSLEVMVKKSSGYHKIFFLFQDLSKITSNWQEIEGNSQLNSYSGQIFYGLYVEHPIKENIKTLCQDIVTYSNYANITLSDLAGFFLLCYESFIFGDVNQENLVKNLINGTLNSIFSIEKNKISKIYLINYKSFFRIFSKESAWYQKYF
jgi:hypothetical protein